MFGVRNIGNDTINHSVGSGDERLLHQSHTRVIKDPDAVMLLWGDNVDCVHWEHLSIASGMEPDWLSTAMPVCESQLKCSAICSIARDGVP